MLIYRVSFSERLRLKDGVEHVWSGKDKCEERRALDVRDLIRPLSKDMTLN